MLGEPRHLGPLCGVLDRLAGCLLVFTTVFTTLSQALQFGREKAKCLSGWEKSHSHICGFRALFHCYGHFKDVKIKRRKVELSANFAADRVYN